VVGVCRLCGRPAVWFVGVQRCPLVVRVSACGSGLVCLVFFENGREDDKRLVRGLLLVFAGGGFPSRFRAP
jgi:hypothetical protein